MSPPRFGAPPSMLNDSQRPVGRPPPPAARTRHNTMVTQHFKPPFWTPNEIPERNGYPRYPDTEMTRRHTWLDTIIADETLDAVVVGGATGPLETSVQYFTHWPPQVPP